MRTRESNSTSARSVSEKAEHAPSRQASPAKTLITCRQPGRTRSRVAYPARAEYPDEVFVDARERRSHHPDAAIPSCSPAFEESLQGTDARPHVLVVDDEFLMRWSVAETLSAEGYAVREAGDGETALRAMVDPRWPVDVVVLDYRLPDTRDLDLLCEMRRVGPGCPIILMTADAEPGLERRALALGARCVIGKPFEMSDLASLIACVNGARACRVRAR